VAITAACGFFRKSTSSAGSGAGGRAPVYVDSSPNRVIESGRIRESADDELIRENG
jgi:hypothetical protein